MVGTVGTSDISARCWNNNSRRSILTAAYIVFVLVRRYKIQVLNKTEWRSEKCVDKTRDAKQPQAAGTKK